MYICTCTDKRRLSRRQNEHVFKLSRGTSHTQVFSFLFFSTFSRSSRFCFWTCEKLIQILTTLSQICNTSTHPIKKANLFHDSEEQWLVDRNRSIAYHEIGDEMMARISSFTSRCWIFEKLYHSNAGARRHWDNVIEECHTQSRTIRTQVFSRCYESAWGEKMRPSMTMSAVIWGDDKTRILLGCESSVSRSVPVLQRVASNTVATIPR